MNNASTSDILVVDDREENILAITSVLEPVGAVLHTANSGEAAIKLARQHDFAAILLDVQMPGMDGFETASHLRELERTHEVPILFITATEMDDQQIVRGYALGAIDYLIKPFPADLLQSKVKTYISLSERMKKMRSRLLSSAEDEVINILVVNDNVSGLLATRTVLAALGEQVKVFPVQTAKAALRLLLKHTFELILLDVNMPDMDGFELAAVLRQNDRCRNTPLAFVTATAHAVTDIQRGYAAGAVDFIFVPIAPELLCAKVTALLRQFRQQRVLERQLSEIEHLNSALQAANLEKEKVNASLERRVRERTSELRETNAVLKEEIAVRKKVDLEVSALNTKLHGLIKSIQSLSTAHTQETLNRIIVTSARELAEADGATIIFQEGDRCHYADEDALEPLWKGKRFPASTCISGWSMLDAQAIVIPDIYKDERIPKEFFKSTFVKSLAMIPIGENSPHAAIGVYWKTPATPAEIELKLLKTLADAAAGAIENIHLLNDLEERVHIRTAQLEAANNELESFAYSVSHDLRAPLRAINGYTQILTGEYGAHLDEEGKRLCSVITTNTDKMGSLIDDLLEFSHIGRAIVKKVSVDMTSIVKAAFTETTSTAERQRIRFKVKTLPPALADESLIKQVWINLISNAVKFSSKLPEAIIEVSCEKDKNEHIYTIKDNGAGFDMQFADKLFEVFSRLHSSTEFAGTGVGLAIVQRIIKRHGGRIWAESEQGKGATFRFTLGDKISET